MLETEICYVIKTHMSFHEKYFIRQGLLNFIDSSVFLQR